MRAELRWGASAKFLEIVAELAAVLETKAGGNLLHAEKRLIQQFLSVLHAKVANILFW